MSPFTFPHRNLSPPTFSACNYLFTPVPAIFHQASLLTERKEKGREGGRQSATKLNLIAAPHAQFNRHNSSEWGPCATGGQAVERPWKELIVDDNV